MPRVFSFSFVRRSPVAFLTLATILFAGCKAHNAPFIGPPQDLVDKPTSGWGLQKLDPRDYPDMKIAWMDKTNLERAIDKSLQFLRAPSSRRWYPSGNPGDTITHDQIVATLDDIKEMIHRNITPEQFQQEVVSRYDVYTSVGYNGKGDVWFTGYFTPRYEGSRTRTADYQYPIYSEPRDLEAITDHTTGLVNRTYPARRELGTSGKLRGLELLWFKKPIEPFLIQVQGSAQVITTTGETLYVGYAGSNGREATGLGTQLLEEGVLDSKHLSLAAVIAYFDQHPEQLQPHILKDDRITFQKIYTAAEAAEWPTGSLNVQVTTDRSIATDKNKVNAIFPRASFCFINVPTPDAGGNMMPHQGFVLDQDNGGAIRAAGRADIYMGFGDAAGQRAGYEYAQGRLYYVFLKPQVIDRTKYPDVRGASLAPAVSRMPVPSRVPANAPSRNLVPGGQDTMFPGAVTPR